MELHFQVLLIDVTERTRNLMIWLKAFGKKEKASVGTASSLERPDFVLLLKQYPHLEKWNIGTDYFLGGCIFLTAVSGSVAQENSHR